METALFYLPKLCGTYLKKSCLVLIKEIFTEEFLLLPLGQERATDLNHHFIQYKGSVLVPQTLA